MTTRNGDAREAKIIPYIPKSRLFLAGLAALCKPMKPMVSLCKTIASIERIRAEHILASLLERSPTTPHGADTGDIEKLALAPKETISSFATRQMDDHRGRDLHRRWLAVWKPLEGEERRFAQRCAVVLTQALLDAPYPARASATRS